MTALGGGLSHSQWLTRWSTRSGVPLPYLLPASALATLTEASSSLPSAPGLELWFFHPSTPPQCLRSSEFSQLNEPCILTAVDKVSPCFLPSPLNLFLGSSLTYVLPAAAGSLSRSFCTRLLQIYGLTQGTMTSVQHSLLQGSSTVRLAFNPRSFSRCLWGRGDQVEAVSSSFSFGWLCVLTCLNVGSVPGSCVPPGRSHLSQ